MRVAAVLMGLALLMAFAPPPGSAVTVSAGFLQPNAQVLVLGELVNVEALESDDFSTSDIKPFFYMDVKPDNPLELNKSIRMHIEFSNLGQTIYESWTADPFTLEQWVTSPIGNNGYYTNDKLDELKATNWFHEDAERSTDFNPETLLPFMDGGNLAGGIYLIRVEVYEVLPNGTEVPLGYAISPIQVASPSRPQPITPVDGFEVNGYPIFVSWTGIGAEVLPMDITLVIVEAGGANFDDLQTVIDNRSLANTRYEGSPQFSDYHIYTGSAGNEQALENGMTYVWMVTASVTSAGGQRHSYSSVPASFIFNEAGGGEMAGGAGNEPGEGDELAGGGGFVNNPDRERDTEIPVPDPVFSVLLQGGLSQEQVDHLIEAFQGFYVHGIEFDHNGNQSYSTLARKLNLPGFEVITVIYEGEE